MEDKEVLLKLYVFEALLFFGKHIIIIKLK